MDFFFEFLPPSASNSRKPPKLWLFFMFYSPIIFGPRDMDFDLFYLFYLFYFIYFIYFIYLFIYFTIHFLNFSSQQMMKTNFTVVVTGRRNPL